MSLTLNATPRGYRVSLNDACHSLFTGFSGRPYAIRHAFLSNRANQRCPLGHKTICVLESIPIIGLLFALIDRICGFVYNRLFFTQKVSIPRRGDLIEIYDASKALIRQGQKDDGNIYASLEVGLHLTSRKASTDVEERILAMNRLQELQNGVNCVQWKFQTSDCEDIGNGREWLEDSHFIIETDEWLLVGLFDGHNGKEVAQYASDIFRTKFSQELANADGDVFATFRELIKRIQYELNHQEGWERKGTTVLVNCISRNGIIVTLTLGDSEAIICRTHQTGKKTETKIVPSSSVYNWKNAPDARRASIIDGDADLYRALTKRKGDAKDARVHGLNVTHALGDTANRAVEQREEIIINTLEEGDVIVMACDGLYDYVPKEIILSEVKRHAALGYQSLAQDLVDCAVKEHNAQDNVTVISIIPSPTNSE